MARPTQHRPFPEDYQEPWSEEEWFAELKRNDARADRFGELLETLRTDPNRDRIISKEMGWDRDEQGDDAVDSDAKVEAFDAPEGEPAEADEQDDEADFDEADFDEAEPIEVRCAAPLPEIPAFVLDDDDDDDDDASEDDFPRFRDRGRDVPEYAFANRIGLHLYELLKPYMQQEDDATDGLLGIATIGPHIASAKIVGGHSLGYSRHYINGNIAQQRVGLVAVDKSLRAYSELAGAKLLPAELADQARAMLEVLRNVLAERIERMRAHACRVREET
jgi:hypothetical protein